MTLLSQMVRVARARLRGHGACVNTLPFLSSLYE